MHESTHTCDTLERIPTTRERSVRDHTTMGNVVCVGVGVGVWARVYIYERGS